MKGKNSAPVPERLEMRAEKLERLADEEGDEDNAKKLLKLAQELREYAAQIRASSL